MYKYSLIDIQKLTESTILLTLKSNNDDNRFMTFLPGQYASIAHYDKNRPSAARCFSIVSSPTNHEILQFSMRTEGRYTNALKSLEIGTRVDIRGPYGNFIYNPSKDKNVVFLAGGIGITPFISMVKYASQIKSNSKISLLYSCRSAQDAPFASELLELETKNPNFKAYFSFSSGEIPAIFAGKAVLGRITDKLLNDINLPVTPLPKYFICGPTAFMGSTSKILTDKGVPTDDIITEAFSQNALKQSDIIKSWPFNVYILSAACLLAVGLTIMAHDLIKTLPKLVNNSNSTLNPATNSANNRQTQIDQTINTLQNQSSNTSTGTNASNNSPGSSNSAPSTSTSAPQPTAAPTKAPTCVSTPSSPC
jgi:ferredoxin-NADP reductase